MSQREVILVGVDGSEAGQAAVRYAAAEARRRDAELRLAHVLPADYERSPESGSLGAPGWRREARARAQAYLDEVRRDALEVLAPEQVSTVLLAGYRKDALVRATSAGVSLVVLGDERRPVMERIATGSVLAGVAAHAPVPVVAVAAGWRPSPGKTRVVAAIKDYVHATGPVQRAIETAEERQAEQLVLLSAWEPPPAYDGTYVDDADLRNWAGAVRDRLEQALKTVPGVPGNVEVRIDVEQGQAARVLVGASSDADLLLIWRRPHGFPFGHLGGTGRAVLRESRCPVMVLPPVAAVVEDDLVGATSA
jgi:nucleotide-binding universal stress UspA family protein